MQRQGQWGKTHTSPEEDPVWAQLSIHPPARHRLPLPLEPSPLRPSSHLCPHPPPPPPQARPPFFTVTIYSSFLFLFVRNSHKNQCKTISVGVLLYITKTPLDKEYKKGRGAHRK